MPRKIKRKKRTGTDTEKVSMDELTGMIARSSTILVWVRISDHSVTIPITKVAARKIGVLPGRKIYTLIDDDILYIGKPTVSQ